MTGAVQEARERLRGSLIRQLEQLLQQAQAGELRSLVWAGQDAEGDTSFGYLTVGRQDLVALIGVTAQMEHSMCSELSMRAEPIP